MTSSAHRQEPPARPTADGSERADEAGGIRDDMRREDLFPIMPVRDTVVFPRAMIPLTVGRDKNIQLLRTAEASEQLVAVFMQRNPDVEEPTAAELHDIGVLAAVIRTIDSDTGQMHVLLQGISRVRLLDVWETEPFSRGRIEPLPVAQEDDVETDALAKTAVEQLERLISFMPEVPTDVVQVARSLPSASHLADFLASLVDVAAIEKQQLLEELDCKTRLRRLLPILERQLQVYAVGAQIRDEVKQSLDARQREVILREQLEAIQRELGEQGGDERDLLVLKGRLEKAALGPEARKEAEREFERLNRISVQSPEHAVIRNYLEWMCDLPWGQCSTDELDVAKARAVLDEDHYGLEEVKERILEYLAIQGFKKDAPTPILCFVGPPGTGKTSLGQSIAKALGRQFVRQSLGGVHDEAEIRGHRRTYVGAMPGKIIAAIRRAGTSNPVMMLDEIDKLGRDFRGDPSSALLEVLDPAQNTTFVDHFLDVPFDLSRVFFVCTANVLETIPAPLLDRMEVIELAGYTEREKLEISMRHLIPRQLAGHGLDKEGISIKPESVLRVIRDYTREAGLRNLERQLARVLRKTAKGIAENQDPVRTIGVNEVRRLLGPPRYRDHAELQIERPGAALGLAWTPAGGEILVIEAARTPGSGKLILTGHLGEVMKESAQAALTYLHSHGDQFGIDTHLLRQTDIHLHVPAGAIPKDGPSAGVAMCCALGSLLADRVVRPRLAMTGEITLRGRVLAVGGIKEKILGAHRAEIDTVLIPRDNADELEHVPAEVRERVDIRLIEDAADVLEAVLLPRGEVITQDELAARSNHEDLAARSWPH